MECSGLKSALFSFSSLQLTDNQIPWHHRKISESPSSAQVCILCTWSVHDQSELTTTGMGGLTCALALAKRGFRNIDVYEYASDLGFVGAGIQLAPNMARVLDNLGVWKGIEAEAVDIKDTSVRGVSHNFGWMLAYTDERSWCNGQRTGLC